MECAKFSRHTGQGGGGGMSFICGHLCGNREGLTLYGVDKARVRMRNKVAMIRVMLRVVIRAVLRAVLHTE